MRSLKEWYRFLRGDADLHTLKKKGMRVGRNVSVQPHCIIDSSHCWLIEIGDNVTIAPRVTILAHDASTKMACGYTKIGLVSIGDDVFIGAGSIVLPGVSIGSGSVVAAGSVVSHDVPTGSIVAGCPARVISDSNTFISKQQLKSADLPCFGIEYTVGAGVTEEMKNEMISELGRRGRVGFVK